MTVGVARLPLDPAAHPFAAAVHAGAGAALRFLRPLPRSPEAWAAAAPPEPPRRREVAAALEAVQTDARARDNARVLGEPGTLAVVAGQQPGLFGGPLLALHKAAAAVNLANALDGIGGRRVVPVFWLGSDDHDLDEARGVLVIGRDASPRRIALKTKADGRSLHDVEIPRADSDQALAVLAETLPDTSRGREALALASRAGDEDLAAWSWRCLTGVLGETGLVLVAPQALDSFTAGPLAEMIERADAIGGTVRGAADSLRAAGLPATLAPTPGTAPVFVRDVPHGKRRRVAAGDAEAARRVRATPGVASGDVIGRVLLQDRLLPVLAFVAGPTEIAYWAQLRGAHDLLGIPFPVVVPRPQATWIDSSWDVVGNAVVALSDIRNVRSGDVPHRVRASVLPGGKPQERVLSPLTPIALHGIDAVHAGLSHLDPLQPGHTVISVAEDGP